MRAAVVILLLLSAAACAPRGDFTLMPDAAEVGTVQPIFVGTNRARSRSQVFGPEKATELSFARVDISVPPQREVGTLGWPKGQADPNTDFLTTKLALYAGQSDFQAALRQAIGQTSDGRKSVMVFVHGYNNNFSEGVYRNAQILHDFDLPEVAVHFSWPSQASAFGYVHDRDSILAARQDFADFLQVVKSAGAEHITVVGHSMGSQLVMETMHQVSLRNSSDINRLFDTVILLSPDIAVDVFLSQTDSIKPLPTPFILVTNSKDKALKLSARVTGQDQRLGNLEDISALADLGVTIIDLTQLADGKEGDHFTVATSQEAIDVLSRLNLAALSFEDTPSEQIGLLPNVAIRTQQTTRIVLNSDY